MNNMKITTAKQTVMGTKPEHFPNDNYPEIVLLGRSNVGKSSFINSLTQRKNLAYTSSTPGKTQTINFYNINDYLYLVDVPGYGYAKVSKKAREEFGKMIETYLTTRKQLKLVVLLVDFRHKPTEDDCLMYNYLKYYNLRTLVVGTKSDKVGKTLFKRHEKIIKDNLNFHKDDLFIKYSSVTNQGREEV